MSDCILRLCARSQRTALARCTSYAVACSAGSRGEAFCGRVCLSARPPYSCGVEQGTTTIFFTLVAACQDATLQRRPLNRSLPFDVAILRLLKYME